MPHLQQPMEMVLKALLNHSKIEDTMRYVDVDRQRKENAIKNLHDLLNQ